MLIAEPLYRLIKRNCSFQWNEEQEKSLKAIKQCLGEPPVLAHQQFGPQARRMILDIDARTDFGIGTVLLQEHLDGMERLIAYGSRSLHTSKRNYCATRLEMLSMVEFVEHFRYYLLGCEFLVRTDYQALKWLLTFREPQGKVTRWFGRLQEY